MPPSEVTSSSERPSGSRTVTRSGRRRSIDDDIAREQLLLGVELDELRERLAHALLRQLDGHAVVEMQVPAAAGDEHRGVHLRGDLGLRQQIGEEGLRRFVGAAADHEGQLGEARFVERHDRYAVPVDDEDLAVALPKRDRACAR